MNQDVKDKVRQLYLFLREANQLRFRPIRTLAEQPKSLRLALMPNHPSVQVQRPVCTDNDDDAVDVLVRVRRPTTTRCPEPPTNLASWLRPHWDDPSIEPQVEESQNATDENGETVTVNFAEDVQRVLDYDTWLARRSAWAKPELLARKAMRFFESFYEIYSALEKDGEESPVFSSGWRNPERNEAVGGVINSNHQYGMGADISLLTLEEEAFGDVPLDKIHWCVFAHAASTIDQRNETLIEHNTDKIYNFASSGASIRDCYKTLRNSTLSPSHVHVSQRITNEEPDL